MHDSVCPPGGSCITPAGGLGFTVHTGFPVGAHRSRKIAAPTTPLTPTTGRSLQRPLTFAGRLSCAPDLGGGGLRLIGAAAGSGVPATLRSDGIERLQVRAAGAVTPHRVGGSHSSFYGGGRHPTCPPRGPRLARRTRLSSPTRGRTVFLFTPSKSFREKHPFIYSSPPRGAPQPGVSSPRSRAIGGRRQIAAS